MKIVLGTDGSQYAQWALAWAAHLPLTKTSPSGGGACAGSRLIEGARHGPMGGSRQRTIY
jgi:hypothetical protein